ncbi:hypothetical protein MGM_00786 [Candida albicans P75063]|nr:hypothetical protein MGM_00786 [Candida albicans P75063]
MKQNYILSIILCYLLANVHSAPAIITVWQTVTDAQVAAGPTAAASAANANANVQQAAAASAPAPAPVASPAAPAPASSAPQSSTPSSSGWLSNLFNSFFGGSDSDSSSGSDTASAAPASTSPQSSSSSSSSSGNSFLSFLSGLFGSGSSSSTPSSISQQQQQQQGSPASGSNSPNSAQPDAAAASNPVPQSNNNQGSGLGSGFGSGFGSGSGSDSDSGSGLPSASSSTIVQQQPSSSNIGSSSTSSSSSSSSSSSGDIYAAISQCDGIDASFASEILDAHNKYRAQHKVGDLSWDVDTYNYAKNNADNYDCSGVLTHTHGKFGENLAAGFKDGASTVAAWVDEPISYSDASFVYNHFTQVIWKGSTKVGCAYKDCRKSNWGLYVVCEYDPYGNVIGQGSKNVFP